MKEDTKEFIIFGLLVTVAAASPFILFYLIMYLLELSFTYLGVKYTMYILYVIGIIMAYDIIKNYSKTEKKEYHLEKDFFIRLVKCRLKNDISEEEREKLKELLEVLEK